MPSSTTTVQKDSRHKVVSLILAIVVLVFAVVIFNELLHPGHGAPPIGSAVQIPGQRTNILPQPDFLTVCSPTNYDNSPNCTQSVLSALNNAQATESLTPMTLPSNWYTLSPSEQLFVATNLERTVRGLPPVLGVSTSLNAIAKAGTQVGQDPQLSAGGIYTSVGANWIQGYSNPLEAIYEWVYDDGVGSSNVACSATNLAPCWGHRANVLLPIPCIYCAMGAAYSSTDSSGNPCSFAEVLVETTVPVSTSFTWAQEQTYLS